MEDIEKFKKYKDSLEFQHYEFLIRLKTLKKVRRTEKVLITILIAYLMQTILMLLLLGICI